MLDMSDRNGWQGASIATGGDGQLKGILFNLLEHVVTREYGADTWDELLDTAGLEGAYTSLGNYADADILGLISATSDKLDMTPDAVLRWFGRRAMPLMAERYPEFFSTHSSCRGFLLSLNQVIHPEVRKLYPGAVTPLFNFTDGGAGALIVEYKSERRLCALAEGFMLGAAEHFGEAITLDHTNCLNRGDPGCVFQVKLSRH